MRMWTSRLFLKETEVIYRCSRWSVVDLPFKLLRKRHVGHMNMAYVNGYGVVWANNIQYLWESFRGDEHPCPNDYNLTMVPKLFLIFTVMGFPSWVSHSRHSHKDFHGMAMIHTCIVHCGHGFARAAPRSARFMAQLQGFSGLWKSASRLDLRDAEITRDHRSHDPDVNMDGRWYMCLYYLIL